MKADDINRDVLRDESLSLLQQLIRNECVNEGTRESGNEVRNADLLTSYLDGVGLDIRRFEAAPGRVSVVATLRGRNPAAPSLLLNGHTDVVPVDPSGWRHDPFSAEVIDGEVWGRGTVDMLNLTASMAVVVRHLAASQWVPEGDLTFFGVADEESGSTWGARYMAEQHPNEITADYVLTENGGLHGGSAAQPRVRINVGEKGVAWRRLRVHGTPGHGSAPYESDNALVKAAGIVKAVAEHRTPARVHETWAHQLTHMGVEGDLRDKLLDPSRIDEAIAALPAGRGGVHACTHMTMSPNVLVSPTKTNTIPGVVEIDVDVRTLPGETEDDVKAQLRAALGDVVDEIEVENLMNDAASISPTETPLWDSLGRAVERAFPGTALSPGITVGFTDARVHRELGAVAYGAGLLSPELTGPEFASRFHGHNERIDIESLRLTSGLFLDTIVDFNSG